MSSALVVLTSHLGEVSSSDWWCHLLPFASSLHCYAFRALTQRTGGPCGGDKIVWHFHRTFLNSKDDQKQRMDKVLQPFGSPYKTSLTISQLVPILLVDTPSWSHSVSWDRNFNGQESPELPVSLPSLFQPHLHTQSLSQHMSLS